MKKVVLDTDTISFYFRNNETVSKKINEYINEYEIINISLITYYELLSGLYYKDAKVQLQRFKNFIDANHVLLLNKKTIEIAAEIFAKLRKSGVTIGHRDVMIAACAVENEMTLITNNTKHFKSIKILDIENWL